MNNSLKNNIGTPIFTDFQIDESLEWQMSRAEKYCLMELLKSLKPDVAIEIGTYKGGSLQVISHYSKTVYSVDISAAPAKFLESKFSNVNYVVGEAVNHLTEIFSKVYQEGKKIDFILVDGDHTRKGVYTDLEKIFSFPHQHPITVLMHDSFNPECRMGIKNFLKKYPTHVSYAELDYITGSYWHNQTFREMWGGLALVHYDPNKTSAELQINQSQKKLFESTFLHSIHLVKDMLAFLFPLKRRIFKALRRKNKSDIYYDFD